MNPKSYFWHQYACVLLSIIYLCSTAFAEGVEKAYRSAEGLFALKSCSTEKPCIYGQLKEGATLYLLGTHSSRVCKSRVTGTFMAGFEAGDDFPLTHLDLESCKGFPWKLAVVHGASPVYKIIKNFSTPAPNVVQEVEKKIRQQVVNLETSGEHPIKLSSKTPKVISLPSQANNTYIVTFENLSDAEDPTHFLFAHGHIELIHGAAKLISTFTLDGKSYALFNFGCKVGCGWGGHFIMQFNGTKFRTVMFEDAGST